jgi:hypothetical protein
MTNLDKRARSDVQGYVLLSIRIPGEQRLAEINGHYARLYLLSFEAHLNHLSNEMHANLLKGKRSWNWREIEWGFSATSNMILQICLNRIM